MSEDARTHETRKEGEAAQRPTHTQVQVQVQVQGGRLTLTHSLAHSLTGRVVVLALFLSSSQSTP